MRPLVARGEVSVFLCNDPNDNIKRQQGLGIIRSQHFKRTNHVTTCNGRSNLTAELSFLPVPDPSRFFGQKQEQTF